MSSAGEQSCLLHNATRELSRFAAETATREIPPDVLERVKLSFLDGLGVCLRGTTFPWTKMVHEVVREEGGNGLASLWGSRSSRVTDPLATSAAITSIKRSRPSPVRTEMHTDRLPMLQTTRCIGQNSQLHQVPRGWLKCIGSS